MLKRYTCFYSLFLFPVLLLVLAQGLWALDGEAAASEGNSESALSRLTAISTQLSDLNGRLQNELSDSRKNSRELQSMLESSKQELEELRLELEALRKNSAELLTGAVKSQTELNGLKGALKKAESSLLNLEISWEAYRESAEGRIKTLSKEKNLWKWGCIAASALAAGLGAAFLAAR
jgi:chromosome segregation ATPase